MNAIPKREKITMTNQYRRVVTGTNPDGKSAVLFDSSIPLVDKQSGVGGARQEDRGGAASSVTWTTKGFPVDNNDDSSDAGLVKVNTAVDDGTVLRIVQYAPGVKPRHHRTDSIDYAIVMSGSIELELDTETVKLATGDVLVQRGTIHNWINNGSEPCTMAYILIGGKPVTLKNGVTLQAQG